MLLNVFSQNVIFMHVLTFFMALHNYLNLRYLMYFNSIIFLLYLLVLSLYMHRSNTDIAGQKGGS